MVRRNLNKLELASPAKINLFFRVLAKRPDGYHEIASLYQAIDLCDRLFFSLSDFDQLTCTDPTLPCDGSNLIVKAVRLFRTFFPNTPPFHIALEKNIPLQAGLGGGSSNAATTLWALNEWMGRPANLSQLLALGAQLGSDVPFFFSSGTAYCTGRGEILAPFQLPHPLYGWLAKPSFGLSTPLVYQNTRVEELAPRNPQESLRRYPDFFNDLEKASFRLEPRLGALQEELKKSFAQVTMTGSGTAFFCLQGTPPSLEEISFIPFRTIGRSAGWYEVSL